MGGPSMPRVPVSWGELIDKITILEIKHGRMPQRASRANVRRELELLLEIAGGVITDADLAEPLARLREINAALWEIEDAIRVKEAQRQFDDEFVALARSVYQTNDERAAVKRRISEQLKSALIEEKLHSRPPFLLRA